MNLPPYPFRLLKTGFGNAFYNMGLDQAILESVAEGKSLPTLRLYGWDPPAVSLGYFQGAEEELNLEACRAHGIDAVRRITGGGAVFHHKELTYSIMLPEKHPLAGDSIQESYGTLCTGIIKGLELLGISSQFMPVNDIVSGGKKISGNAQTRKRGCILQHGTILLDVDAALMFELLRVPSEKMKNKLIADVKERVIGLNTLLGYDLAFERCADALAEGFRLALSLDFGASPGDVYTKPETAELFRAKELARDHFSSPAWIHRR